MKKIITLIAIGLSLNNPAQHLQQVLILNEGYFDYTNNVSVEPVKIGSYDPSTSTYTNVNTLSDARFASDLIVADGHYYVAADSLILKYDLDTHQELARVSCSGVRNLAFYDNKLIATRGDYDNTTFMPIFFNSYLKVYNSSDLSLHTDLDTTIGPKYASQNIVINNDNAFIAVNNAYEWGNEKGIVGVLNLNTMTYGNEINLGSNGINPDNIVYDNGYVYTVNNKDWTGSSVSKIDASTFNLSSTNDISTASTGCGTSCLKNGKIIYQISMENTLNEFDVINMTNIGPLANYNMNFYALSQDPTSGNLFASNTDFFSYGKIYVYDEYDNDLYDFSAGITPGKIVFDVRFNTGIIEDENLVSIYPNPSSDKLNVNGFSNGTYEAFNILGEKVMSGKFSHITSDLDISTLKNGKYILTLTDNNNKTTVLSFVKI